MENKVINKEIELESKLVDKKIDTNTHDTKNIKLKGGKVNCCNRNLFCILNSIIAGSTVSFLVSGIVFLSLYFTNPKVEDIIEFKYKDIDLYECDNSTFVNCLSTSTIDLLNQRLRRSGFDYCFGNRIADQYLYDFIINDDQNCRIKSSSLYLEEEPIISEKVNSTNKSEHENDVYEGISLFYNTDIKSLKINKSPFYNNMYNFSNMFCNLSNLREVQLYGLDFYNSENLTRMFNGLNNLTIFGLKNIVFHRLTFLEKFFYNSGISNSDMSGLQFDNLKEINNLFYESYISNIDLSFFKIFKCRYVNKLFKSSIIENVTIDNSIFNEVNVLRNVFDSSIINNLSLVNIDFNITTMIDGLFVGSYLNNVVISNIRLHSLRKTINLFKNSRIDRINIDIDAYELEDLSSMFENTEIENINFTIRSNMVRNLKNAFRNTSATSIEIYGLSTLDNIEIDNFIEGSNNLQNFSFDNNNTAIENVMLYYNFSCDDVVNRTLCFKLPIE